MALPRKTSPRKAVEVKKKPGAKPSPAAKLNGKTAKKPAPAAPAVAKVKARPPAGKRADTAPAPARKKRDGEAAATGRGKYVYCVIRASGPREFGAIGLGSTPTEVHTIHYKNIAAVVSDTPIEVHEPTRENVLAH